MKTGRKQKIYLEDLIDLMIDRLYKARAKCHSPGDKFAIDLFLDIRAQSRRCVSISRSRIFSARRGGWLPGDKSNVKAKPVFEQTNFPY